MRLAHCALSTLVWSLVAFLPVTALAQDEDAPAAEEAPAVEEVDPSSPAAEAVDPSSPAAEGGVGDLETTPAEEPADGSPTPPAAAGDDEAVAPAAAGDDEAVEQPAAEEDGAVTPAAAAEETITPAASTGSSGSAEVGTTVRTGKVAKLGEYRLRIGAAKPTFNDGLKFYEELYGDTKWYPTIMTDWYLFDWYATIGLTFRGGYYTADGYTAKQINKAPEDIEASDIEKNYNGPTTLTLIPLQAGISISFAPLARKWLVIDGWVGMERMYWQEVRSVKEEDAAAAGTATAMIMQTETEEEPEDDTLTNKGWKNASVVGASANILLNWMDGETANSMRGTLGLGFVYLTPFMEIVRTTSKDGVSFGRSVVGMGFTFESVN